MGLLCPMNWLLVMDWIFPRWCKGCQVRADGQDWPLGFCWSCMLGWPDLRGFPGNVLFRGRVYGMRGVLGFRLKGAPELHSLVHEMKYGGNRWLARAGGQWVASGNDPPSHPVLLVPVPLHWRRAWKRGYNQAHWIAQGVGDVWGVAVRSDILRRAMHQVSLTQSGRKDRQQHLAFTFLAHPFTPNAFPGHSIYLVDDVLTTGATLRACTAALEDQGWSVAGAVVLALA